jgi:hypothetical protein
MNKTSISLKVFSLSTLLTLSISTSTIAYGNTRTCLDKKDPMTFNENQILNFKEQMDDHFLARAFVRGIIVGKMENRAKHKNHLHLEVDLDGDIKTIEDRIEVIQNLEFGAIPDFEANTPIIACGDFKVDKFAPFGAIIHWTHRSPDIHRHEGGFLIINNTTLGIE